MFGRKKKDDWWQQTHQEQNEAVPSAEEEIAAPDASPETDGKKKHRWAWLDAAGDVLEVVIDFITGLFD
jgi:hypothetical protein